MIAYAGYQIICGCTLIGCVLAGHVFSNSVFDNDNAEEMNKRQTLKCNNHCAFGFVPDVEGELTCTCYDPCSTILCLQGTVCVATMPQDCRRKPCRAEGRCEEKRDFVEPFIKQKINHGMEGVPDGIQRDGPWWSDPTDTGDICSKPLPTAAVDCQHFRRRWFYNSMTGKCERFEGCPSYGNNFSRKRYCKEQCRYRYMTNAEKSLKMANSEEAVCFESLMDSAKTCDSIEQTKRWYYNAQTGKCEKFIGCKTPGNNFSRKILCKSKCLKKRTYTKYVKESYSPSRSAR